MHIYSAPTACKHRVSGSLSLPSRGPFHLSFTVLCAIGHWVVFSLTEWSPLIPTRFHVSRGTLDPAMLLSISDTRLSRFFAGLPRPFSYQSQINYAVLTPQNKFRGLGSFPFARRYLGNRSFFLFLRVLRCFSSPRSLLYAYRFSAGYRPITTGGFPHSDICGLTDICSSPQLFAACHVLLRRPVPRHPPCALSCLTFLVNSLCEFAFLFLVSLGAKS